MQRHASKIFLMLCVTLYSTIHSGDFSIGARMITEKNIWNQQQLLLHTQFNSGEETLLFNGIARGLTKNTGVQLTLPVILRNKRNSRSDSGLGNIILLGQWQFYKQPSNLGVVFAGVIAPTRTTKRRTSNPSNVASYLFDATTIHSSDCWYAQANGVFITTPKNKHFKPGNIFLYTLNAGPKINIRETSLFSLLALRGIHANDDKLHGKRVISGGDILLFGPQFGMKRKNITLGGAFGWPVMQRLDKPLARTEWFGAFLFQVDF